MFKSQAGAEFVFILSIVIALSVFVISNAFREDELNLAIAAARQAGEQIALKEGAVLMNVSYSVEGNKVILTPGFSDSAVNTAERKQPVAARVKGVLAPYSQWNSVGFCFNTTREFCIE
ncbi:MAG: hypothetical protein V1717_01635 [Candidatus Micrarchaeota archaeon]